MDHHWLITWTCYGTWLPGDVRGFVGNVRNPDGTQVKHNIPGTPFDADMPLLQAWACQHMKGPAVQLDRANADVLIGQYLETAGVRQWELQAASVMYNHTHVVVGVPGDPEPDWILETLKSWATRGLKKMRPLPANGTFWTAKGSKRKLQDEEALRAAVIYVVKKQRNALAVWFAPRWRAVLDACGLNLASRARRKGPGAVASPGPLRGLGSPRLG